MRVIQQFDITGNVLERADMSGTQADECVE